jgi:hypothetical protein
VHPVVVHLAQLVGAFLWRLRYKTEVFVVSEDTEMLRVLSCLDSPPEPVTLAMVYTVLGEYLFFKRQIEAGQLYLVKASQTMSSQELSQSTLDLDGLLSTNEPDEDTKEFIAVVTQLTYINKSAMMVLGLPTFLDEDYNHQLPSLLVGGILANQHRPLS